MPRHRLSLNELLTTAHQDEFAQTIDAVFLSFANLLAPLGVSAADYVGFLWAQFEDGYWHLAVDGESLGLELCETRPERHAQARINRVLMKLYRAAGGKARPCRPEGWEVQGRTLPLFDCPPPRFNPRG